MLDQTLVPIVPHEPFVVVLKSEITRVDVDA